MIIPADKTARRDLTLIGECPDCGKPGLHKMPRRVLVCKLDPRLASQYKARYEHSRRTYELVAGRGYHYSDYLRSERTWLEDAREEYNTARRRAMSHTYLLLRECYACDYQWFELIREFESDDEATALRERYPDSLVVFEGD